MAVSGEFCIGVPWQFYGRQIGFEPVNCFANEIQWDHRACTGGLEPQLPWATFLLPPHWGKFLITQSLVLSLPPVRNLTHTLAPGEVLSASVGRTECQEKQHSHLKEK